MRVAYLASGAAGMYCGSCLRDNRLAATLIEQGRDVVLLPMYTPLRTDETDVSQAPIYYGGINVYLEQHSALFRKLPRWMTTWLDAPGLLRRAMRFSSATSASDLGAMTVSVLRGEDGAQRRELERLIEGLRILQPSLVNLPFLLMLGVAKAVREALRVPVLCTLTGEDIFIDDLHEPFRTQTLELIRQCAQHVDGFISVTRYYADHAARHFGLPRERIHVVPMGVRVEDFDRPSEAPSSPFTIAHLARICPAKGLKNLAEALVRLRKAGRDCRVRAAGYLAKSDEPYLEEVRTLLRREGVENAFEYLGEVDRAGKVALLRSSHVFCVPTNYREAKGVSIVEALAAGLPVVQPRHGSFPELVEATGGGLLYDPGSTEELCSALIRLMEDEALRLRLGASAKEGARKNFSDVVMAEKTWAIYEGYCAT